jgi:hypothetical protein
MQITINGVKYTTRNTSDAKLIEIPIEGQTPLPETQELIDRRSYPLSSRNGANAYILPTDANILYLNFIPQKVNVSDTHMREILKPEFEYYVDEVEPTIDAFTLEDGIIYRCVSVNSLPKNKEDYTYYIMVGGRSKLIPNYRTLEVMLAEREQTLLSVRIIESQQCSEIPKDPIPVPDKSGAWVEDFTDVTSVEALTEMENNAKAAAALVEEAKAAATEQIDAVKEQAAASKAEAEAAKAEAAAAKAEADAAKADAEAAIAAANSGE